MTKVNEKTEFEYGSHKYVTVYFHEYNLISHYAICPDGNKVRIDFLSSRIMTLPEFSLWIKVGRPLSLDKKFGPDELMWMDFNQNSSQLNFDTLTIKQKLQTIKVKLVIRKSKDQDSEDGEDDNSPLNKTLVKTLNNLDLIKDLVFKEVPYLGFYQSGVFIESHLVHSVIMTEDEIIINLGLDSHGNEIPKSCVEIMNNNGWVLGKYRPLVTRSNAKYYTVFNK
jgi:hypothetical protein